MNRATRSDPMVLAFVLVGLYVWAVAAFFGVTVLDTAYAAVLRDEIAAEDRAAVFSEIGDFLLLLLFATLLAALAAVASCWSSKSARYWLIASVAVMVLQAPALVLLDSGLGMNLGPALRIPGIAAASALALLGFARLLRPTGPSST